MNILSAQQIREWDEYTIRNEPIASVDLMERAASQCANWITSKYDSGYSFHIFCGRGNNGGDGLAIARLLIGKGYCVDVYILETGKGGSPDFTSNLERLNDLPAGIHFLGQADEFPSELAEGIIIDALLGTGLNGPAQGLAADLIRQLNDSGATIISIDLPSGLQPDAGSRDIPVVEADFTLTFQCYKTALLVQDNAPFIGEVHVLRIGLHTGYLSTIRSDRFLVGPDTVRKIFRPRNRFAHKGVFGHALLVAGSYGKVGAAVLAARSCLKSGIGLLTCYIPACGYTVLQTAVPEAMVMTGEDERILTGLPGDIEKYQAIGMGPGLGTADATANLLNYLMRRFPRPLVLDADALNIISTNKDWLLLIPEQSIITPHPKEFDRLFGEQADDFTRMATARSKATELRIVIVVKGHHTIVACPQGNLYFNTTGNAGMAKAGSGDVLTGILTALVAQGYGTLQAALLGVYLHGMAGDVAARTIAQEAMTASDLIDALSTAFIEIADFQ